LNKEKIHQTLILATLKPSLNTEEEWTNLIYFIPAVNARKTRWATSFELFHICYVSRE